MLCGVVRGSARGIAVRLWRVMLRGGIIVVSVSMKGKKFMLIVITIYAVIVTVLFILSLNA